MTVYYFFLAVLAAMVLLCLLKNRSDEIRRGEIAAKEAEIRAEHLAANAELRQILFGAYMALKKAKGAGYRCWLAACISKLDEGRDVPSSAAILALEWTEAELSARFKLSGVFSEAVEKIKGLGA